MKRLIKYLRKTWIIKQLKRKSVNDEFLERLEVMWQVYVLEDESKLSSNAMKFRTDILKAVTPHPYLSTIHFLKEHGPSKSGQFETDEFQSGYNCGFDNGYEEAIDDIIEIFEKDN